MTVAQTEGRVLRVQNMALTSIISIASEQAELFGPESNCLLELLWNATEHTLAFKVQCVLCEASQESVMISIYIT